MVPLEPATTLSLAALRLVSRAPATAAAECCRSDRRPTTELRRRLCRQAAGLRRSEELPYPLSGRHCLLTSGTAVEISSARPQTDSHRISLSIVHKH
eukprot:COSAG02_NODE_806_length_16963_cov_20.149312_6_plen_97_part_00